MTARNANTAKPTVTVESEALVPAQPTMTVDAALEIAKTEPAAFGAALAQLSVADQAVCIAKMAEAIQAANTAKINPGAAKEKEIQDLAVKLGLTDHPFLGHIGQISVMRKTAGSLILNVSVDRNKAGEDGTMNLRFPFPFGGKGKPEAEVAKMVESYKGKALKAALSARAGLED